MGFKRTTEGRIFFEAGGASEPEREIQHEGGSFREGANISPPNQMQLQILGLLKSLNERLRATQADRDYLRSELETYKGLVHDLKRRSDTLESRVAGGAGKAAKGELSAESLKELAETRKVLAELEEKADKTESDLKRQMAQIKQNETAIRQKQIELEQLQQAHQAEISRRIDDRSRELSITHNKQWEQLMSRIDKREEALSLRLTHAEDQAKAAADKGEEAISSAGKVDRKLEKALQERTRLIRKLERIEETVIQTHDALNARAMVLLTDQNTAAQSHFPHKTALSEGGIQAFLPGDEDAAAEPQALAGVWWKRPLPLSAVAMTGIVVVALLSGWMISQVQTSSLSEPATDIEFPLAEEALPPQDEAQAFLEPDAASADLTEPAAGEEFPLPEIEKGLAPPPPLAEEAAPPAGTDDIGTKPLTEQDKIAALLESDAPPDMDAIAAQMNAIEPGAIPPQEKPAPVQESAPKPAPLKSIPASDIAGRVKPDSNLPAVVKEIEAKAFEGSPEAQHDLAAIYTAGHGGVTQDYKKAATWFAIAAEGGVANAAYNLGVLHHQGIGVKQDLGEALDWYQKAADQGHPEAQYNLGIAHIEGVGLPYDADKAAQYFENAARAGVMEAAYNLGLIYENGLLGESQPDEALMWYKTAADKGSPEAKAALDHLAKSLNVRVEDVNKLVDGMKTLKSGDAAPAPEQRSDNGPVPLDPGPSAARTLIAGVQQQLMNFGLYPGPADGLSGPITEDAIRSYQTAYGLPADGQPTDSLLSHMMSQSMKAMTEGLVGAGNE